MTEARYFQIREEYGIFGMNYPSKEQIANMTEKQVIEQMEILKKAFEGAFNKGEELER